MHKRNKSEVPHRLREGRLSYLMLQKGDVPDTGLSITWVEVEPGSVQRPHTHPPEQVTIIVQGRGEMTVGKETGLVGKGDMVHIPPQTPHRIKNIGEKLLVYVTASAPA
jgi:quercetin dioxygenase-like cupin family protein